MPKRTGRPWQRLKAKIIRRDGGICHLCGQPGADTADHLQPVALGGPVYDPTNLAAAHQRCNTRRHTKPIDVARARIAKGNVTQGWKW